MSIASRNFLINKRRTETTKKGFKFSYFVVVRVIRGRKSIFSFVVRSPFSVFIKRLRREHRYSKLFKSTRTFANQQQNLCNSKQRCWRIGGPFSWFSLAACCWSRTKQWQDRHSTSVCNRIRSTTIEIIGIMEAIEIRGPATIAIIIRIIAIAITATRAAKRDTRRYAAWLTALPIRAATDRRDRRWRNYSSGVIFTTIWLILFILKQPQFSVDIW